MTKPVTANAEPTFSINGQEYPLSWIFGRAPKADEEKGGKMKRVEEDAGEFYVLCRDFFSVDLDPFTDKYPFVSAVAAFALGFFALMYTFSFSPSNILIGLFLGTLSLGLGKSLIKLDGLVWRVMSHGRNFMKVPDEDEISREEKPKKKV